MIRLHLPKEIRDYASVFREHGYALYVVGGAIRNLLLGKPVADWDTATDAPPEEVIRMWKRVIPTGIKHGTVTVHFRGHEIETTTFRVETDYADGRRPDGIVFTPSLLEDLKRRDLTINGMACDPETGELTDPHGGREDLKARIIRAIGDPTERFNEDGLRPLRAIRFASVLGFDMESETLAAIPRTIGRFALVSIERVREEFEKMLVADSPSKGLRLMEVTGLLSAVLPELAACRGVEQKGMHRYDVLDHLYASCDATPGRIELRLAALLHDVMKPQARREEVLPDGSIQYTFYNHERLSADACGEILRRLTFPNKVVQKVEHLVRQHMFSYDDSWTDAAVRRFVARVGEGHLEDLYALRLADASGMTGAQADPRLLSPLVARVRDVLEKGRALGVKDLAIGGNDLALSGIPPGPAMGRILAELLDAVIEDPSLNERERLLTITQRIRGKYGA